MNGGELSAEYQAYIVSDAWKAKRVGALERAGDRCQVCNRSKNLHVHHRTYERFGDEAPEDLTVLCRPCHELFHEHSGVAGTKRQRLSPEEKRELRAKRRDAVAAAVKRLAPGNYKRDEIAKAADLRVPASVVTASLKNLEKQGLVRQIRKRYWRLHPQSERPASEPLSPTRRDIEVLADQLGATLRSKRQSPAPIPRQALRQLPAKDRKAINKIVLKKRKEATATDRAEGLAESESDNPANGGATAPDKSVATPVARAASESRGKRGS